MSPLDRYGEINAISTACSNGLKECRDLVVGLYSQWMNNADNNP